MRGLFETDGFCSCIEAENGETGIRMAREHPPDLIILDLLMPGMTEIQVAPILQNFSLQFLLFFLPSTLRRSGTQM
jgi:CheY-like chemotaxis protein